MKFKKQTKEGEIFISPKGYCVITDDGDIYFPEFIYVCQDDKGNLYAHGALVIPDNSGELEIWEKEELRHTITIYNIERFLKYDIICNSEYYNGKYHYEVKRLSEVAEDLVQEATFRGVYVSPVAKEYVKNKEFLKKFGNGEF